MLAIKPIITLLSLLCLSVNAVDKFKIIVYGGATDSACLTKDQSAELDGWYQAGWEPCYKAGGNSFNAVALGMCPFIPSELCMILSLWRETP